MENFPDGLVFHKVVLNETGDPSDYVFVEMNAAFEALTGLSRTTLIGQSIGTLQSEMNQLIADWIEVYQQVGFEGKPVRREKQYRWSNRWYEITAYRDSAQVFGTVFRDITDSKQEWSFFGSVVESIADGLFMVDERGKVKYWNRRFRDLWHVPSDGLSDQDDQAGIFSWIGQHLADPDRFLVRTRELNDQPERTTVDLLTLRDGRFIEYSTQPHRIDGSVSGRVWFFRDRTEHQRSEQKVRDRETFFYRVIDALNQPFAVIDADSYTVEMANNAYGGSKAVGRACYEVSHQQDSPCAGTTHPCPLHIIRQTDRPAVVRHIHTDVWGNPHHIELYAHPVYDQDGQLKQIIEHTLDITDRVKAEEALRYSEQKLAALFSSMTEMVVMHEFVYDAENRPIDYRITDCNQAFTNLTGLTRETVIGKLATEVYQTGAAPYLDRYSRVAATGKPGRFEVHDPLLDKYLLISVVSPGAHQFATITTDITISKHLQQQIESKNRELEQLVYITSHDLRSPLVNIEGFSKELLFSLEELHQVLEADHPSLDHLKNALSRPEQDMDTALRYIRNSAAQMDALLKGLLRLSRLGRAGLVIEKLDMNDLVFRMVEAQRFQADKTGVDITVNALPPCLGDAAQVSEVFTNLVDNALKYLDPDRPGVITIGGEKQDNRSVYWVKDNGIGIATAHQKKVFEVFHRLDPDRTSGEGLGLTIVRQVVERLGGDLWIESEPGVGSLFYVALPAVPMTLEKPGKGKVT